MKNATCVTEACIKGQVDKKVRELKEADFPPQILLSNDSEPQLVVTRYGNTELLHLSCRAAEELIAAGFSYGN